MDFLRRRSHNALPMTAKSPDCTGECGQCSGIHIAVPPAPEDDLHLLRMSVRYMHRFMDQADLSLTLRLEDPGSMYARGARERLLIQSPEIRKVASQMGWRMDCCLNGAAT